MSDGESRFEFTRRRLLSSVAVTGVATAGAGAGTMAYLSDTEQSSGNSIAMGTLELTIDDDNDGTWENGESGTWSLDSGTVAPGDGTQIGGSVKMRNEGSIEADHAEIDVKVWGEESSNGSDEADTLDGAEGMGSQFKINELRFDPNDNDDSSDENLLPELAHANENERKDLDDLAADETGVLDDLTPPGGGTQTFTLDFEFADDPENNKYQGDILHIEVTYALFQSSGQDI